MFTHKTLFLGLLLLAHYTHTFVLLTASIDDVKKVARKFVSEAMAKQIADFIAKASGQQAAMKRPISAENEQNEDKVNNDDVEVDEELTTAAAIKRSTAERKKERVAVPVNYEKEDPIATYTFEQEQIEKAISRQRPKKIPSKQYAGEQYQPRQETQYQRLPEEQQEPVEINEVQMPKPIRKPRPNSLRQQKYVRRPQQQIRPQQEEQRLEQQQQRQEQQQQRQEQQQQRQEQQLEEQQQLEQQPPQFISQENPQERPIENYGPQKKTYEEPPEKPEHFKKPPPEDMAYELISNRPDENAYENQYRSDETTRNMPPIMEADSQVAHKPDLEDREFQIEQTEGYDPIETMPTRHRPRARNRERFALLSNDPTSLPNATKATMIIEFSSRVNGFNIEPQKLTTERQKVEFDQYDNLKFHAGSDPVRLVATSGPVGLVNLDTTKWWENPLLRAHLDSNSTSLSLNETFVT